jgi:aldehyde:ferredoxin oxidoreductase
MATTYGGWTGKTLRVNLSTRRISTEDTIAKYKDYLGSKGVGYRVLWDEVPAGTKAYDEANKIIIGVGPLTGTSAPCSGRTSIVTIFPTTYPEELVATGHMGGHWGAELKYAGWDNVIIEGKSEKPVYLAIVDDKVEIRDASHLWGTGIYLATTTIGQEMGPEAQVATIGQAGENLVRMAVVNTGNSHSAGGVGGVFGSKKLKAIAVRGSGAVRIAGNKQEWKKLIRYALSIMGALNNIVVPRTPQPWAEFSSRASRWTARKGLFWGAADPPIETGECSAEDLNRMGFRSTKLDMGRDSERYLVRMGGCSSCPIRCHSHYDVPQVEEKYGLSRHVASTCTRMCAGTEDPFMEVSKQAEIEANAIAKHMLDDYGIWDNYSQLGRDFLFALRNGIIQTAIPAQEYNSIPWDQREKGDLNFLLDIYRRIALREGELGFTLGEGSLRMAERWKFPETYFRDPSIQHWKMGSPRHHGNEAAYQVGVLVNMNFNANLMCHSHTNFIQNCLPINIQKDLAAKMWGSDAIDPRSAYTPMNPAKARFAVWTLLRNELHDSLTLCEWMYPISASPLKSRNYEGDIDLEAKLYSLVTGDKKDGKELDLVGERIHNLHRALTIRDMNTMEMRSKHDTVPDWVFEDGASRLRDRKPFTPGTSRMDRDDIELAKDMYYEILGWDKKTGAPTRAALERVGLKDVADKLAQLKLLPY